MMGVWAYEIVLILQGYPKDIAYQFFFFCVSIDHPDPLLFLVYLNPCEIIHTNRRYQYFFIIFQYELSEVVRSQVVVLVQGF